MMRQIRTSPNKYAEVFGMEYMEEFINIFLHVYTCDEFEAVRECDYIECPICGAKSDSDGYFIHKQIGVN